MIQRIQTLYLALAAVLLSLLFLPTFSPIKVMEQLASGETTTFNVTAVNNLPLLFFVVIALIFVVMAVFLFKNRKIQVLIAAIAALWSTVIQGVLIYQKMQLTQKVAATSTVSYSLGMILPFLALLLTVLAIVAIRKDDAMVKSSDRLR
jgi:hypothetical protein